MVGRQHQPLEVRDYAIARSLAGRLHRRSISLRGPTFRPELDFARQSRRYNHFFFVITGGPGEL